MDAITKEFVATVRCDDDNMEVGDILPELARLNLESKISTCSKTEPETLFRLVICYLAFDVRMDSFSLDEKRTDSITSRLIESAEVTNSCILPLDQGLQLWRHFETPVYRKMRMAQEFMER